MMEADHIMIDHAPEIAEWCEADGRWLEREHYRIPKERWWWLDEIAEGRYPVELLSDYLKRNAVRYAIGLSGR